METREQPRGSRGSQAVQLSSRWALLVALLSVGAISGVASGPVMMPHGDLPVISPSVTATHPLLTNPPLHSVASVAQKGPTPTPTPQEIDTRTLTPAVSASKPVNVQSPVPSSYPALSSPIRPPPVTQAARRQPTQTRPPEKPLLPEPKVAASSARVHGQDVTPVPAPAPSFKFGGLDPGSFGIPTGVAVDGNGNIYVADPIENRIQKFDAQGNFVLQFQLPITCSPATGARLAIDQSSFVYIIGGDAIRGCGGAAVYKFTDTGTLINSWRVTPSFYSFAPAAVAVDNHGFVYTALGNTEPGIYKWTTDGVFVKAFTLGIPNAKDWFTDITTDGTYLYTKRAFVPGAPDQHTFAKFDLDGNLISEWGDPSQFNDGAGIALDASGNIYMVGNNNILKFSKDGQLLGQFGSRGQGSGQFFDPVQLTFDSQGRLYVEDALNSRVQIFDANGTFIRSFGRSTLYIPGSACITGQQIGDYVDGQGNIYVVDEDPLRGGWRVSKFDATGQLLMRNDWADSGFAPGLTGTNANSIVVDKNGNIYLSYWQVTGNGVDRSGIVKLTPSGDFIAANGLATNCYDEKIAIDDQGFIWFTYDHDDVVIKYDSNLNEVLRWSTIPVAPRGIAVDSQRGLVFLPGEPGAIFTTSGTLISLGSTQQNGFYAAIDSSGNYYATDQTSGLLSKYPSGSLVPQFTWCCPGYGAPMGISVDQQGTIYVAGEDVRVAGVASIYEYKQAPPPPPSPSSFSISGHVTDTNGNPVANGYVYASISPGNGETPITGVAQTDANGSYLLNLPAGSYQLLAVPPANSGLLSQQDPNLVSVPPSATVDFQLPAAPIIPPNVSFQGLVTRTPGTYVGFGHGHNIEVSYTVQEQEPYVSGHVTLTYSDGTSEAFPMEVTKVIYGSWKFALGAHLILRRRAELSLDVDCPKDPFDIVAWADGTLTASHFAEALGLISVSAPIAIGGAIVSAGVLASKIHRTFADVSNVTEATSMLMAWYNPDVFPNLNGYLSPPGFAQILGQHNQLTYSNDGPLQLHSNIFKASPEVKHSLMEILVSYLMIYANNGKGGAVKMTRGTSLP